MTQTPTDTPDRPLGRPRLAPRPTPLSRHAAPALALAAALALTAAAALAPPAAAQDANDATTQTAVSFFAQFLWSSDLLGLAIIWLLVVMSMASIAFAIFLFVRYRRATLVPESTREEIAGLIERRKYRDAIDVANADPSYLGSIVYAALTEAPNGYAAMERAVEETGDAETTRVLRPLEYLNVLGNIAPMIGLFGTVYGMIVAFQQLVATGGDPDPQALAAGISTALVTTFWGLVVAIPALAAYALVRNRVDAITADGMIVAEQIIRPFRSAKSGSSRSSSRSGSSSGSSSGSDAGDPPAKPSPDDSGARRSRPEPKPE